MLAIAFGMFIEVNWSFGIDFYLRQLWTVFNVYKTFARCYILLLFAWCFPFDAFAHIYIKVGLINLLFLVPLPCSTFVWRCFAFINFIVDAFLRRNIIQCVSILFWSNLKFAFLVIKLCNDLSLCWDLTGT